MSVVLPPRPRLLDRLGPSGVVFLACLAVLLILRALPVWAIGFHQDDSVASSWRYEGLLAGQSVFGFCHQFFKGMLAGQGRIIPVYCFVLQPFLVFNEDNLVVYRIVQSAAQLVSMGAFAFFIAKLTRSAWVAGLSIVLFVAFYEIRDYHDSAFGQFVTFPVLVTLGSLACHQALVCGESSGHHAAIAIMRVALLNALAILTLDYAIPFALLSCVLLLFTGNGCWRTRIGRACIAGLPIFAMITTGVLLRRHVEYSGTELGSLSPVIMARTYGYQLVSALPLSYYYFDPSHFFTGSWRESQQFLPAALAGIAALAAAFIASGKIRVENRARLLVSAGVLLLIPPLLLAPSLKYQSESAPGLGYLQTVFSYLGFSLLVALGFDLVARKLEGWRRMRAVALFLLSALPALCAGNAYLESCRVADKINEIWRYPREILEVWLHARYEPVHANECYVIDRGWLNRWENFYFLAQHTGRRGQFVTVYDAGSKLLKAVPDTRWIHLRYPFRSHPTDLTLILGGFAAADSAPGHVSALVVSRDREKLAQTRLRLVKGSETWEFPPDIETGWHSYYFRRLRLDVASPLVGDYQLGLQ